MKMWWRFLTFCVLVTFVLFVVLSCIHGRPVIHLFFHRCCEEDIENDQVIFENFGNNFLRERLVGADIIVDDKDSFVSQSEAEEVMDALKKLNVHDPKIRSNIYKFDAKNNDPYKELVSKLNDIVGEENVDYNDVNYIYNDTAKDSDVTIGEMTSKNDGVSELDSQESVEVTTEAQLRIKTILPIKLVDVSSSYKSEITNRSETSVVNDVRRSVNSTKL